MQRHIAGTWRLETWRRYNTDGSVAYPFGKKPRGILIYTRDGRMAVQMLSAERATIDTTDPLGGSAEARAAAYSTCLAYFGSYEVDGETVIHRVDASLFPNWSETVQARPFVFDGGALVLQVKGDDGRVTNEMIWARESSECGSARGDLRGRSGV